MKKRLFVLIGLIILIILFIMYTGERIYLWALMLVAAIFILAALNIGYTLLFAAVRQSVNPGELTGGMSGELVIEVWNSGVFPLAHMDIWYDTDETMMGGPDNRSEIEGAAYQYLSSIVPQGKAVLRRALFFPYRGVFTPGVIQVELRDVFGLLSLKRKAAFFKERQQVTVLPRALASALDDKEEKPFTGGAAGGREEEEIYSISDIRQFRPGDPLKRVHWKLSARVGELLVKEFDGVLSPRVAVFLDLSPHGLVGEQAAALEDCMCRNAAAICRTALDGFTPLQLVAYAEERRVLSGISVEEFIVFRRFLASVRFTCPFDFTESIRMELDTHPETSHIVIITTELSAALTSYAEALAKQDHSMAIISVSKDFAGADETGGESAGSAAKGEAKGAAQGLYGASIIGEGVDQKSDKAQGWVSIAFSTPEILRKPQLTGAEGGRTARAEREVG